MTTALSPELREQVPQIARAHGATLSPGANAVRTATSTTSSTSSRVDRFST